MRNRLISALGTLLLISLWTAAAPASLLSGVTATTDMGTFYTYDIADLTNGSGLSHLGLDATHDNLYYHMWMSNQVVTGTVTFDLQASYSILNIGIWNYNFEGSAGCCYDRGVQDLEIYTSPDNVNWTFLTSEVLFMGDGSPIACYVVPVASVDARYVRFDILSNYGSIYTGISEVQFDVVQPTATEDNAWSAVKALYR